MIVTTQHLLDEMEIDSINAPEVSTNAASVVSAPSPMKEVSHELAEVDTEMTMAPVPASVATNIYHGRQIGDGKRVRTVTTAHDYERYEYENKDNIPLNGKVTRKMGNLSSSWKYIV